MDESRRNSMAEERTSAEAKRIQAAVETIKPLLAGKPPKIQGAALAELTAIWVTGHRLFGEAAATREIWQRMLKVQVEYTKKLLEMYAGRMKLDD